MLARNAYGSGQYSSEITILSAQVPETPDPPTTAISGSYVIIDWNAPVSGGSSISSYTVYIMTSDLVTYLVDTQDCDGSKATIVSDSKCTVPIASLLQAPFNLPWGSSIWAKVMATNSYGNSKVSEKGNGAKILTNPDAPVFLSENYQGRTATALALVW